jgi:orotidine-5'-phosphate decarboxylase
MPSENLTPSFGETLLATFETYGHLCVGIDPHPYLLAEWGLDDSAEGAREFGLRVVEAAGGLAGIVKPQVAFFERYGSAGFLALEKVLGEARASGLVVIADAKRGDIGSTAEAYGAAWLTPGSPLEADALTVNAYQGVGSLDAPIALALRSGKGLFALTATSNPEAVDVQTARLTAGEQKGVSVAASIVDEVNLRNSSALTESDETDAGGRLGSIGVVIGATVAPETYGITASALAATPILAPGFGHQGVGFEAIPHVFGSASENLLVSSSRAILAAGPSGLKQAIATQIEQLAEVYAR